MSSEQNIHHVDKIKCLSSCAVWKMSIIQNNKNNVIENKFESNRQASQMYNELTCEQIINQLREKEENNVANISQSKTSNLASEKMMNYPIDNTNISIWEQGDNSSKNATVTIEFDLSDNNNSINNHFSQIDKNFVKSEINCTLNGVVFHDKKTPVFKNDIQFILKPKRLIKSIQICIEAFKNKNLTLSKNQRISKNLFFINIIETNNIAILVKKDISDLAALPTNFNAVVNGGFILQKIYIILPVPDNIKSVKNSSHDLPDDLYSTSTLSTFSQSPIGIPVSSSQNSFINLSAPSKPKVKSKKSCLQSKFNLAYSQPKKQNQPIVLSSSAKYPTMQQQLQIQMQQQLQMQIQSQQQSQMQMQLKIPLMLNNTSKFNISKYNNLDSFSKAILENYKKNNTDPYLNRSICNFSLFELYTSPKIACTLQNTKKINLNDIFSSFSSYSTLGINLPLIKDNKISKETYSPTLSSLTIIPHNSAPIAFSEVKPPFMRLTFNEQIDLILNKEMKQLSIDEIDKERSYFCVAWNPLKATTSTIFLSFYQFEIVRQEVFTVGILPIKLDYNYWLGNLLYDKLYCEKEVSESIQRVETFVYINSFSTAIIKSSDYDYYYANKFISNKNC